VKVTGGTLDNSTLPLKASLRLAALEEMKAAKVQPLVLESHGGYGAIFQRCYSMLPSGSVIEIDDDRAEFIARQRRTWAVYGGDAETILASGILAFRPTTLLDLDPYGEPWPFVDAFFQGHAGNLADRMWIAVNDGLRMNTRLGVGARTHSLAAIAAKYGASILWAKYIEVAREMMEEKAATVGYTVASFRGYYCGDKQQMTHYLVDLRRTGPPVRQNPRVDAETRNEESETPGRSRRRA
jgi:hypothetical protein